VHEYRAASYRGAGANHPLLKSADHAGEFEGRLESIKWLRPGRCSFPPCNGFSPPSSATKVRGRPALSLQRNATGLIDPQSSQRVVQLGDLRFAGMLVLFELRSLRPRDVSQLVSDLT
jgi:hypothetical protein